MKVRRWLGCGTLALLLHGQPAYAALAENYSRLPLHFEANRGQAGQRSQFVARGPGYKLGLSATEAHVALKGSRTLQLKFVEGNTCARLSARDKLPGQVNYLVGKDPRKWLTGITTFAMVKVEQVYEGIDLIYYGNQGQLEFDFIVAPNVDASRILFAVTGGKSIRLDEAGDLQIAMTVGAVKLRRPVVYQNSDDGRQPIEGSYTLLENQRIGFRLARYDRTKSLIIDPVLVYSTYLGGSGSDTAHAIAVDNDGSAYVTGFTQSTDFPAEGTSPDNTLGGTMDVFVTKLNPDGTALEYSTYLGGTGRDGGYGIAVDADENAYVSGFTESTDFPTSNGALDTTLGGVRDSFVTKLGPTGEMVYSTYLGGANDENGVAAAGGIAVNADGNAFVCGYTASTDFPTTTGAFDRTFGGALDAFVSKLNANGSALVYSTLLGGSMHDFAHAIVLDESENAYVTGATRSSGFPTTAGAYDRTFGGGSCFVNPVPCADVFVSKLNTDGSALLYSTFLGGSAEDTGFGIAVDGNGMAIVTGDVNSNDFPTNNAVQSAQAGFGDAFVTKLSANGSSLVYSTYLGGAGGLDEGFAVTTDALGNAYIAGQTSTGVFPTTPDALSTNSAGGNDAFLTRLSSTGTLDYSSYLGGSSTDYAYGLALDSSQNIYLTGFTGSTNFPTVTGSYNDGPSSGGAAYVAKLSSIPAPPFIDLAITKGDSPDPATIGSNLTYALTIVNSGTLEAPAVTVADTLPASVTFVMASSSQGSCSHNLGTVGCALGTLGEGQTGTVTIVVTTTTSGSITNLALVATSGSDVNSANNTAQALTTVAAAPPDLMPQIENVVTNCDPSVTFPSCVLSGDLTLKNNGTAFATGTLHFTAVCKGCPTALKWKLAGTLTLQSLNLTDIPDHGLALYLSNDEVLDAGDTLLTSKPIIVSKLAKSFDSGKPVKVKAKAPKETDLSGKFLLLAQDDGDFVAESNDTNNTAAFGPLP